MPMTKEQRREISLRHLNKPGNRKKHSDYNKRKIAELRADNYERYMLQNVKTNAKRTGRLFALTEADIVIPDVCPVLGIPLRRNCTKDDRDSAPSVDRIDNDRGYTPDNVVVVSMRANQLKGTATVEELEKVLFFYKGLLSK